MSLAAMVLVVAGFVGMSFDSSSPRLWPADRQLPTAPSGTRADVGLGECSTDFTVRDEEGHPVPSAVIRMQLRHGMFGLRRMDVIVATDDAGRGRVQGLPVSASLLRYDVGKGRSFAQITQDLSRDCRGRYDVTLD